MANVADFFIDTLKAAGVRRIWGLPGDSLNAFTDALRRDGERGGGIRWMHMRHEEAAAFAAGADAELTGRMAVVAGSCGPGNLHFINGLFDAQRRCSDLNSAVYKYYDNIKKRCLNGEKVSYSDLDVLNLRQCFREFSLEAYPELVALVWPEYARPDVDPNEV